MISVPSLLAHSAARRQTVAIADCVHFCAYRYGRGEPNPYEQYMMGLATGRDREEIRDAFVGFLKRYRPTDLGEALGVQLSKAYPLWSLPWRTPAQLRRYSGWHHAPGDVIDVMTYFSEVGIPRCVVEKEFALHESAWESIRCNGYQPELRGYITARKLAGPRSTYLVTDGNHRLSALSALGVLDVKIKLPLGTTIKRDMAAHWPLVRSGQMAREDAVAVFDAYFAGNTSPMQSDNPAALV